MLSASREIFCALFKVCSVYICHITGDETQHVRKDDCICLSYLPVPAVKNKPGVIYVLSNISGPEINNRP